MNLPHLDSAIALTAATIAALLSFRAGRDADEHTTIPFVIAALAIVGAYVALMTRQHTPLVIIAAVLVVTAGGLAVTRVAYRIGTMT
jgi:hypothetical protein